MISTESKDDAHGYHEDNNGERVTLIDGERMPNSSWDSSNDIPTYGYGTTNGILEDTGSSGLLEMRNENNIVYTWARNTIYVMSNGSEDGQFESLTGSTSAIMSKGTRDQKTLSVADSLNRDRDTINNGVNRETIGKERTAIRSGEPPNGRYGNNGYTWKSSRGTENNNTNQRMGSSIERKEKSHSTDGRGVSEYIGLWQIRILECGRRGASYVHVS